MADRSKRERKLISLMINDFEAAELSEARMSELTSEVENLSDEELGDMLTTRLGLSGASSEAELDEALDNVSEPELISGSGLDDFTRAPDMSHEPRPEEREG
ncbi:hypothetical protein [Rubrobacter aplysinae]|uniref:hypothetical protein n=1 Tax=Rubrobacter aplysinae TaxID=909625 RepID=UPI00064B8EA7|nr:hypothetical protein [Rubrobacter aplysinae]